MILDLDESTPLKSPQPDVSPPSPPPYVSYQAISETQPLMPQPVLARQKSRGRNHRFRRRCLVVASGALNCVLLVLLIHILRHEEPLSEVDRVGQKPILVVDPVKRPVQAVDPDPRFGRCLRNATWSNAESTATEAGFYSSSNASFLFPDSASPMYLVSQGALSGGTIHIHPSSSDSVPRVELNVRYRSAHVLDRANICWMEHNEAAGVGIFTPAPFDGQTPADRLDFTISLFLPTTESTLPIYNLETNLPSFTHSLGSLKEGLEFDRLILKSQNQPISAKSVFARNGTIQTSNSPIEGSFETSASLSLITSNAPIDASINLYNKNIFSETHLFLQTRNAQLESDINLLTTAASGEGGKFIVTAQTADTPLVMSFPASPARSILTLDAQTSNSPADVWLNTAFEGEFTLASSMVFVDRRPFLDPRKLRSVLYGTLRNGMVVGNVKWKLPVFGKSPAPRGQVKVKTSNDILKLYV
ncbi:hypothetical protein FB45DRAFT_894478 [Roridomyces roridus]|uniref:Uncharacterized protein n=1 Tax=Roridomyces roridus TaxID=1738132 RepID=A0AAD7CGG1_9AGAR|nr:hypothetical protein FB45DRAFT_894478 [Roridomyces roridus]